jgi:hypothetical protein
MYNALVKADFQVYVWPFDWRQDILSSASAFALWLFAAAKNRDFYVVGHSQGGLVAQMAYPTWLGGNPSGNWKTTTYLGVPHGGTYWGPAGTGILLTPGFEIAIYYLGIANTLGGNFPDIGIGKDVLVQLKEMVVSWPSVLQMGPSPLGPWKGLDDKAGEVYKLGNWTKANSAVTQSVLDNATAFQTGLNALLAKPRPKETCIAGNGQLTLTGVDDPWLFDDDKGYLATEGGDGTVPYYRAILPNASVVTTNASHVEMIHDDLILANLADWITNPPDTTFELDLEPEKGPILLPVYPPQMETIPNTSIFATGANKYSGVDP